MFIYLIFDYKYILITYCKFLNDALYYNKVNFSYFNLFYDHYYMQLKELISLKFFIIFIFKKKTF